jgi:hypothetical protein
MDKAGYNFVSYDPHTLVGAATKFIIAYLNL